MRATLIPAGVSPHIVILSFATDVCLWESTYLDGCAAVLVPGPCWVQGYGAWVWVATSLSAPSTTGLRSPDTGTIEKSSKTGCLIPSFLTNLPLRPLFWRLHRSLHSPVPPAVERRNPVLFWLAAALCSFWRSPSARDRVREASTPPVRERPQQKRKVVVVETPPLCERHCVHSLGQEKRSSRREIPPLRKRHRLAKVRQRQRKLYYRCVKAVGYRKHSHGQSSTIAALKPSDTESEDVDQAPLPLCEMRWTTKAPPSTKLHHRCVQSVGNRKHSRQRSVIAAE